MSVSSVSDSSRQIRVEEERRRDSRIADRAEQREQQEPRARDPDKGNRVDVKA